jgi:hypothetical protein
MHLKLPLQIRSQYFICTLNDQLSLIFKQDTLGVCLKKVGTRGQVLDYQYAPNHLRLYIQLCTDLNKGKIRHKSMNMTSITQKSSCFACIP